MWYERFVPIFEVSDPLLKDFCLIVEAIVVFQVTMMVLS